MPYHIATTWCVFQAGILLGQALVRNVSQAQHHDDYNDHHDDYNDDGDDNDDDASLS